MIIAEIGQNHCGSMGLAKRLILLAKDNGADLVKFQLYDSEKLYSEKQESELSYEDAKVLFDYGKKIGIEVFFSVFDVERVKWCEKIGVKRYKIAYSQRFNRELINSIYNTGKEVIISNNGDVIISNHSLTRLLYCIPSYPASPDDYHLKHYKLYSGISDHTIGLDCAKTALSKGAQIIEKHFSIDHETGVDAEWSMTPSELKELKRFEEVCSKIK